MKGVFITFEGVEGCGKSTQIAFLADHLRSSGFDVDVTREPGGTPIAEAIRALLLDPDNAAMVSETELLLYVAARAQHVAERIRPAIERGTVVLCDRFHDSTTAYQGAGRALPPEALQPLHDLATRGLQPDLTFLLDLPAEAGLDRARGRGRSDRIEREDIAFHTRVREAFLDLARGNAGRITMVDAAQDIEAVAEAVRTRADVFLADWRAAQTQL